MFGCGRTLYLKSGPATCWCSMTRKMRQYGLKGQSGLHGDAAPPQGMSASGSLERRLSSRKKPLRKSSSAVFLHGGLHTAPPLRMLPALRRGHTERSSPHHSTIYSNFDFPTSGILSLWQPAAGCCFFVKKIYDFS